MKSLVIAATAALSLLLGGAAHADERPWPLAEVMLVGVYHMHNPGADTFNIEADDVLADRRQAEIAALTERMAGWAPDLIMVEWPREDAERMAARYAGYRAGGERESRNEIFQLGFRLADRLDHDRLAAIDVRTPFMSEQHREIHAAPDARNAAISAEVETYGQELVADSSERLAALSIGDYLAHMNSPEALTRNHDFYVRFMIRAWQGENQGGAHTVANWYERNILTFQNILREVEESDGAARRVIVFIGQGHAPILAQLIEDTPWLALTDPAPYLAD